VGDLNRPRPAHVGGGWCVWAYYVSPTHNPPTLLPSGSGENEIAHVTRERQERENENDDSRETRNRQSNSSQTPATIPNSTLARILAVVLRILRRLGMCRANVRRLALHELQPRNQGMNVKQ